MRQRTTITLNKEYLRDLKQLAVAKESNVSELLNLAVGRFLLNQKGNKNPMAKFLNVLGKIKKRHTFTGEEIKSFIEEGRK